MSAEETLWFANIINKILNIQADAKLRYKWLSNATYPNSVRFDGLITVCLVLPKHVTKHKTKSNLGNMVVQPSLMRSQMNPQPVCADSGRLNERSLLLNNNEVRPNKEHAQGKEEKVQLHYEQCDVLLLEFYPILNHCKKQP